jgi:hypothetical protein
MTNFLDPLAAILVLALPNNVIGRSYNFSSLSYPGATMTGSYGLNDLGKVVGEYFVSGDIYPKGFIYTPTEYHGTYTPFTVTDAISTTLNDINNAGDLVGAYRGTTGKFPYFDRESLSEESLMRSSRGVGVRFPYTARLRSM